MSRQIPCSLVGLGERDTGHAAAENRPAHQEELLSDHYCPAPGCWDEAPPVSEIDEIAGGSFKRRQPPEIVGSGYVVKSLEAALWAFYHGDSFREGCLLAVNLVFSGNGTTAVPVHPL